MTDGELAVIFGDYDFGQDKERFVLATGIWLHRDEPQSPPKAVEIIAEEWWG